MRVGLFGGSFDPIHIGHCLLAQDAIAELELDRLLLAPTAHPPHKPDRVLTPIRHRLAMTRAASMTLPGTEVIDVEASDRITYTVDTLRWARNRYGDLAELVLVLGGDSLRDLPTWREPEAIRSLATLAVFHRPGAGTRTPSEVRLIPGPPIEISSTEVRSRVLAGRSIQYWVPDAVAAYIHRHGLYQEEQPGC